MNRTLATFNPFVDFERMIDGMDRALDSLWGGHAAGHSVGGVSLVPVDIYERDNTVFITASVPGVAQEDLDISVEDDVLTLRGEFRQSWEDTENTKVYRRERRIGRFTRSFQLPENLQLDKIEAVFDNGHVTIQIPKMPEIKPEPKKVPIRAANVAGKDKAK